MLPVASSSRLQYRRLYDENYIKIQIEQQIWHYVQQTRVVQHEHNLLDVFELVVWYLHPRVECLDEQRLQGVAFFLRTRNVIEGLEQVLRN